MRVLGCFIGKKGKGVYEDKHEVAEQVRARNEFVAKHHGLRTKMLQFNIPLVGHDVLPPVSRALSASPPDNVIVWIFNHDESVKHANGDTTKPNWFPQGRRPRGSTRRGLGSHVSAFVEPALGLLHYELLQIGQNREGYWNSEMMCNQFRKVLEIASATYARFAPVGFRNVFVFIFDHSTGHHAYAKNALRAADFNRNPGKKRKKVVADDDNVDDGEALPSRFHPVPVEELEIVKDGYYFDSQADADDSITTIQTMTYPPGHEFAGYRKSLTDILQERKLITDAQYKAKRGSPRYVTGHCKSCKSDSERLRTPFGAEGICCLTRLLQLQPDFAGEKPALQEIAEAAGHQVLFLPKYHPELNWIELFWAKLKSNLSDVAVDIRFSEFHKLVGQKMDKIGKDIGLCRRMWANCIEKMELYRLGVTTNTILNQKLMKHSSVRFKSHRGQIFSDVTHFVRQHLQENPTWVKQVEVNSIPLTLPPNLVMPNVSAIEQQLTEALPVPVTTAQVDMRVDIENF